MFGRKRGQAAAERTAPEQSVKKKLTAVHIGSSSPYFRSLTPTRRTFILLCENWWLLVMICAIIATSLCYYNYTTSLLQSSVTLAFNYQESSNGQYPNKTRLSMSELKSETVLAEAIQLAGLEGELTTSDLSQRISINPAQVKSVSSSTEDYYLATSYNITLSLAAPLDGVSCEDLLSLICIAYSDYFFDNYTENDAILSTELQDLSDVEYYVAADMLESHANQLLRYLNMRISSTSSFNGNDSITECKNLMQQLNNFISYDIDKYRSFIMQTGMARDLLNYKGIITYDNMQRTYEYDKVMDAYYANRNGLDMYDVTMSATVLIPTLRSDNNYYMGKTNSAMDYFTQNASTNLASASTLAEKIALNERLLNALNSSQMTAANMQTAESLIVSMRDTLITLSQRIQRIDEQYVLSTTRDYLKFTGHGSSFSDRLSIRNVALACALFLVLTGIAVFSMQSRAKWKAPLQFANAKEAGEEQT